MPSFIVLFILCLPVVITIVFVLPMMTKRKRRRCFVGRPIMNFEDFFNKYYNVEKVNKNITCGVHKALSHDVGVQPTQILPSDRFSEELALDWWGVVGDEDSNIETYVEELLELICDGECPNDPLDYIVSTLGGENVSVASVVEYLSSGANSRR